MILVGIPDDQHGLDPHMGGYLIYFKNQEEVNTLFKEFKEVYRADDDRDTWYGFGGWLTCVKGYDQADLEIFHETEDDNNYEWEEGDWNYGIDN